MKKAKAISYLVGTVGVMLCVTLFLGTARLEQEHQMKPDKDQTTVRLIPSLEGEDLFRAYCASCHGVDGKGQGPVAAALTTKVSDLTTISKRNGGVFPAKRVGRIIAGDEHFVAHGSREMPIWGPIFHQVESDRDFGNVRLRNVTKYIETIQTK